MQEVLTPEKIQVIHLQSTQFHFKTVNEQKYVPFIVVENRQECGI